MVCHVLDLEPENLGRRFKTRKAAVQEVFDRFFQAKLDVVLRDLKPTDYYPLRRDRQLSVEMAHKIFNVLVKFFGANERNRSGFVQHHSGKNPPHEWACGWGKFRLLDNRFGATVHNNDEHLLGGPIGSDWVLACLGGLIVAEAQPDAFKQKWAILKRLARKFPVVLMRKGQDRTVIFNDGSTQEVVSAPTIPPDTEPVPYTRILEEAQEIGRLAFRMRNRPVG